MPRLTKEREKYIRDNWKESPFITDLLEEIDGLTLDLDNVMVTLEEERIRNLLLYGLERMRTLDKAIQRLRKT